MTLTDYELIRNFGRAAMSGTAALFIGAGMSLSQGVPDWQHLLRRPRREAGVPNEVTDLPLAAEFIVRRSGGDRRPLENHIRDALLAANTTPGAGHHLLERLPIHDLWTTNYDRLIESGAASGRPGLSVVTSERELQERRTGGRRLMKMHGSLASDGSWEEPPVITRSDYEAYERLHPRMWAALRATYLTQSFLFLGFSFADPNIEVLLRLARSQGQVEQPEHYTVLRRPESARAGLTLHELRVEDLYSSGVAVCEIDAYSELEPLLERLVRRTRQPLIFVSGSDKGAEVNLSIAEPLGTRLADVKLAQLSSLGGEAGQQVAFAFSDSREARGEYWAEDIAFYFRGRKGSPSPELHQRAGMAIHTGKPVDVLRRDVIDMARALALLGGGDNSMREAKLARELGVPVVPLPTSGGAARQVYREWTVDEALGGTNVDDESRREWTNLDSPRLGVASAAAVRLLCTAAFLGEDD